MTKLKLTSDRAYKAAHARWQRESDFATKVRETAALITEFNHGEKVDREITDRALEFMTPASLVLKVGAALFGSEMNGQYWPSAIEEAERRCHISRRGELSHLVRDGFEDLLESWIKLLEEGKGVKEMSFKSLVKATLLDFIEDNRWTTTVEDDENFI